MYDVRPRVSTKNGQNYYFGQKLQKWLSTNFSAVCIINNIKQQNLETLGYHENMLVGYDSLGFKVVYKNKF